MLGRVGKDPSFHLTSSMNGEDACYTICVISDGQSFLLAGRWVPIDRDVPRVQQWEGSRRSCRHEPQDYTIQLRLSGCHELTIGTVQGLNVPSSPNKVEQGAMEQLTKWSC